MSAASARVHRECMRRWADAATLAELGELGALWLEGLVPSQPGYEEMCGPDEETAHLVPVLARLNRAGFYTSSSQPGGYGVGWQQRAAIEGYIDEPALLSRIKAACRGEDLHLIVHAAFRGRRDFDDRDAVMVTWAGPGVVTRFGVRLSRRYLRSLYGETGALHVLYGAWQVTVVDLCWGDDDVLWAALDEALRGGRR